MTRRWLWMWRRWRLTIFAVAVGVGWAVLQDSGGTAAPSVDGARAVAQAYLDAASPVARCALYTNEYATENPEVLLSGGCLASETGDTGLQRLGIVRTTVHGDSAIVTVTGPRNSPGLNEIELLIDRGQWRINGFVGGSTLSATAKAYRAATSPAGHRAVPRTRHTAR